MVLMFTMLILPALAAGQTQPSNAQEGKVAGNYVVQQSMELGYRVTGINGNESVYSTFVNLQDGPRLLDYTVNMRAITHVGSLFDNFYLNNAGYGGDPNNYSRLRVSKNRWYDFSGSFRRDLNYFDFNTLANPYNTANPYVSNAVSPHAMSTSRKMGDFNLTVAPQSPVRLRLGYARNVNEGPSFVTYHEGTDIRLNQNYRSRGDRYQVGADWKFAPRTQLSYDLFFEHSKMDTSWVDSNLSTFQTPSGLAVDLGVIYEPVLAKQPCGVNAISTAPVVSAGNIVKPDCNLYSYYSRTAPTRADFTTHQLSLVTNYFKNLDLNLAGTYSSGQNEMADFLETANTYVSRTNEVGFQFTGPAKVNRVSSSVDFGGTYHFTEELSLSNQMRWYYWRIPGTWDSFETACFASLPVAPSSVSANNAPPPYAGIGTAPGAGVGTTCAGLGYAAGGALSVRTGSVTSPVADTLSELYQRYTGEESMWDTTLLNFEPSRKLSLHAGFRYGNRNLKQDEATSSVAVNVPYLLWVTSPSPAHYITVPATTITTAEELAQTVNEEQTEKAFLAGFHASPFGAWRIVGDVEKIYVDAPFTRIAPRNGLRTKLRTTYRIKTRATVGASMDLFEGSNDVAPAGFTAAPEVNHRDHNHNASVYANVTPAAWLNLDVGYTYGDILSRTGTCMPIGSGIGVEGGTLAPCVPGTAILPVVLRYSDITNTGYFNLMVKPVKRVTVFFGYELTSTSGSLNWYRADTLAPFRLAADKVLVGGLAGTFVDGPNPRVAAGAIAYNFTRPAAGVALELVRNVTLKGAFNYYDYNEKTQPTAATSLSGGVVLGVVPRDFHGNTGTISVKYAF
jgi:hypothetical protein